MASCSKTGCFAERNSGDALFCMDCRESWKRWCGKVFGVDVQAPESMVFDGLRHFCKGGGLR